MFFLWNKISNSDNKTGIFEKKKKWQYQWFSALLNIEVPFCQFLIIISCRLRIHSFNYIFYSILVYLIIVIVRILSPLPTTS